MSGIHLNEDERVVDADDPKIRLLICYTCNSIDPLPYFDGPVEYDVTLLARAEQHRFPDGNAHFVYPGLARVSEVSWADPSRQKEIIKKLLEQRGGDTGLDQAFYDVRSTFEEDAMKCWRVEHNRTTDCGDYKTEPKRLLPDTREERRELGLSVKSKDRTGGSYLCDFCPYRSIVQQRVFKDRGLYS